MFHRYPQVAAGVTADSLQPIEFILRERAATAWAGHTDGWATLVKSAVGDSAVRMVHARRG